MKKRLSAARLVLTFALLAALTVFSALAGCGRDKPAGSDSAKDSDPPFGDTLLPELPPLPTGGIILPDEPIPDD